MKKRPIRDFYFLKIQRRLAPMAIRLWLSGSLIVVLFGVCFSGCGVEPGPDGFPDKLDSAGGCSQCHGSEQNYAPPKSLTGETQTSARGVGAHQIHLTGSGLGAPVSCKECHHVPITSGDEGHIDTLPADLTWGPLASMGTTPEWQAGSAKCLNVYCHGESEPVWTVVDGTYSSCGSCHGMPPADPHTDEDDCEDCHEKVVGENDTIIKPDLHINGVVDFF